MMQTSAVAVSTGMPPSTVVCVLGMHRSGTSMVTRLAAAAGVRLGPDDLMMRAHEVDNPTGYWEYQGIVDINDRILEAYGGSWDDPPVFDEEWEHSPGLLGFRAEARELMAPLVACGDVIGWKDPRMSLLLPFWNTVIPITATLLVHRHPFAVAASLASRDGMDSEQAAALWSRYTVEGWRAHPNRAAIAYEYALADPEGATANIASFLDLGLVEASVEQELAGFVDPSLNRNGDERPEIGPAMTLALSLHAVMESQDFGTIDAIFGALHDEWLRRAA